MQPMNSSLPTMTLERRLALIFIRDHQPVMPPVAKVPPHIRIGLLRAGLIEFDPKRKRFDPPAYCLTARGREALG